MTDSQRREIECHLEDTLVALRLQDSSCAGLDMSCADENEFASRLSELRMNVALQARIRKQIREVEEALRRLDVADFGICLECGDDIPVQRLKANPTTTLCVHCQQEQDRVPCCAGVRNGTLGLSA
ncbi:TraR/DksA family transcriptional regulator [Desulfovibrio mangrovi]|uniref:TraR/DksA family transcriptional regulator n=1 Tax=Desulfovibrio mangrovi TaxID=2976983 RepID=UPI002247D4B2|nr:TraR/DksA family transcriptional regulator [Desulfovibrio mangrovi]UZP66324.1 TraR/DksA family transcriptional regulator [Desulfovibrio mangrovi]